MVGKGEESWIVRDANGDEEVCPRDDIITDHDDASILIKVTHFQKIITLPQNFDTYSHEYSCLCCRLVIQ